MAVSWADISATTQPCATSITQVRCVRCTAGFPYIEIIDDPAWADSYGCDFVFNAIANQNGQFGYINACYIADTNPNLNQTTINAECDSGSYRLILIGYPQYGASNGRPRYSCPSGDGGHTYTINLQEWYPYWDTGSDGDEAYHGTANDDEQQITYPSGFTCTWGWIAQQTFGWPYHTSSPENGSPTDWNNPAPTSSQFNNEYATLDGNCSGFSHTYGFSDGKQGSGVDAWY